MEDQIKRDSITGLYYQVPVVENKEDEQEEISPTVVKKEGVLPVKTVLKLKQK